MSELVYMSKLELQKEIEKLRTALAEKEKEVGELKEKIEGLEYDNYHQVYKGNSIGYLYDKMKCYMDVVGMVCQAFRDLGYKGSCGDTSTLPKRLKEYTDKRNDAIILCVEIGKKIEEESIDQSIEPGYQIEPDSQQALISLELLRELFKAIKAAEPFVKKKESEHLKPGQRIKFLKTLTSNDSEESPGNHYASEGDLGTIDRVGGCWEGFWVFWDGWSQAAFGCKRKDFELVNNEQDKEVGDE